MLAPSIGIVILTLNAEGLLPDCLPVLLGSPLKPRILVIDSTSNDGTVNLAKKYGVEVIVIPRSEFNHGLTREKGRLHLGTDIVMMMTQDAIPTDHHLLEHLISPIISGQATISYGRQLPHHGADIFESFPREFNDPASSHIRSYEDRSEYGAYTFFCSDSCAAYCNKSLDQIGGFKAVLFGEDTLATAELLLKGHRIAYVAEASVRHSHRYTLKQEFQRNFDIGLFRKQYAGLFNCAGNAEKRGFAYLSTLTNRLLKENKYLIPYAYLQTACKWIGYRMGQASLKAPIWWKKALSSQKFYWDSPAFLKSDKL